MTKILIADDHVLIREGLKKILKEAPDITVAGEARDGQQLFEILRKVPVEVLILDISLPGKSGLELLKDVRQEFPKVAILILSMHPEDRFAVRALKAGASGYVTKESAAQVLIQAIRKVVQGRKYISPSLAEKLAVELEGSSGRPPHELLSDREYQVLCMIALGKSIKQISAELYLSVSTVNTYRSRVLEKMNMKTDAELIRYAVQNQLID